MRAVAVAVSGGQGAVATEALAAIGRGAGLCAVGFCQADRFTEAAAILRQRKQDGLHAGMQFTYRNPDRSTDPSRLVAGAAALIVGALDYHRAGPGTPSDGRPHGRVAAYARTDHYRALRTALEAMAEPLRAGGFRAVVSADENSLVDRAAAYRAGIGWQGKSANILVPGAGSLVVLGAVVTDAPLIAADPEPAADGCGACRQCLDGCPTGAIVAPGTVDARRCLAWLVQQDGVFPVDYRIALGDRLYGCDDCTDACPPNRVRVRMSRRSTAASHKRSGSAGMPSGERAEGMPGPPQVRRTQDAPSDARSRASTGAWAPLLEMLAATDQELMSDYGRWYIPRLEARYLRRNALVVLANVGDPADACVRAAVDSALAHPDPLVRAHAVWCARRLGLGLECLHDSGDPLVQAELHRAAPSRAPATGQAVP